MARAWVWAAAWGLPVTAVAQEPDDEAAVEIVVTGTRARDRSALDATAPVDVFAAGALRSSGAVGNEVGEALSVVAPSFFFPRQSNSGTSDHVRAGQLRGLSPDQMLVLINGRRAHTSAVVSSETKIGRGTAAFDFNTIPLGAIRRIEVLRDGAGAQYGSDAIAGVINLILDDDAETNQAALTAGVHVTHEGAIDQTLVDGETATVEAETGVPIGTDGFLRLGIEALVRQGTNRAGFDQVPFFYVDPYDPNDPNLGVQGQRNYVMGDPRTRGLSGWFNTAIPAGRAEIYGFGTVAVRDTQGATFFRYPQDPRNVPAIYPDGFRPITTGHNVDWGLNGGVRAPIGDGELDVGATWGHNRFQYGAIDSVNASLGEASPTTFDSGSYRLDQVNVDATLFQPVPVSAFADPLSVSLGIGTRQEWFASTAGQLESYEAGPVDAAIGAQGAVGLTPDDVRVLSRGVYIGFADLSAHLAEPWFLDLAGRYEGYSDFGNTFTGKAATLVRPVDGLGVRASVSNSVRAPALAQIGFADRSINFGVDRALVLTRTTPVDDPVARALGATDLRPERALDVSAGVTVGPFSGLTVTVDAFRIAVQDRITLSDRLFGEALANFVADLPGGAGVESVRFFTNAVDTETLGIEGVARVVQPVGVGALAVDLGASFFRTSITRYAPTPQALLDLDDSFELVGVEETNTLEDAAPTNKQVVTVSYVGDVVSALVRGSRFGRATRVFNFGGGFEPTQTYGDEVRLDAELTVRPTSVLELAVGATNLLDNYPDRSIDDINFFGNLPYDVLSPIGINGRYLYLRTRLVF